MSRPFWSAKTALKTIRDRVIVRVRKAEGFPILRSGRPSKGLRQRGRSRPRTPMKTAHQNRMRRTFWGDRDGRDRLASAFEMSGFAAENRARKTPPPTTGMMRRPSRFRADIPPRPRLSRETLNRSITGPNRAKNQWSASLWAQPHAVSFGPTRLDNAPRLIETPNSAQASTPGRSARTRAKATPARTKPRPRRSCSRSFRPRSAPPRTAKANRPRLVPGAWAKNSRSARPTRAAPTATLSQNDDRGRTGM